MLGWAMVKRLEVRELTILLLTNLHLYLEIFENVVAGFAAVSADPVENVKRLAAKEKANELA